MNECAYACACVLWMLCPWVHAVVRVGLGLSSSVTLCISPLQQELWVSPEPVPDVLLSPAPTVPCKCACRYRCDYTQIFTLGFELRSWCLCSKCSYAHCEMTLSCKSWVLWSSVFHLCCCRAPWHFPGTSPFFLGLHYLFHTSILLELNPQYGLIDLSRLGWIFWEGSWYQDHSEQGRWLYLQAFDVHGTEPKFCSWLKEPSGPGFDMLWGWMNSPSIIILLPTYVTIVPFPSPALWQLQSLEIAECKAYLVLLNTHFYSSYSVLGVLQIFTHFYLDVCLTFVSCP